MPPAIVGVITTAAAALCFSFCVKDTTVEDYDYDNNQSSPLKNMEGEDIDIVHHGIDHATVSSVGESTVMQKAERAAKAKATKASSNNKTMFLHNQCFPELAAPSSDALEVSAMGSPSTC